MGWHYAALEDRFRRISGVNGALAILDWDTAVMMPRKSAPDRGEQFAVLKRISHELLTHAETGEQPWSRPSPAPPPAARCSGARPAPRQTSRCSPPS